MTNVSSQDNCILNHCRKGSLKMLRLLLLGTIISTNVFIFINHTKFHISEKISTLISLYPFNLKVSFGNMAQIWRLNFHLLL